MMAAIVAAISFFSSAFGKDSSRIAWLSLGRWSYYVHSLAVVGIIVLLFWLISAHYWEYQYVWQHSSRDLPWYYRISCFWEGQEGSFLLWTFWNMVLGHLVLRRADKWHSYVMGTVATVQVFLAMMLIGIYFFEYKLGNSPFILMRDHQLGAPIFQRANYLQFIQDGNGLNPLLQNYWMVIHPPTLFLGFASTLFPFAYVLAALWSGVYNREWTNITLRWALLGAGVLGVGVLMGGAWAYEALSFGGFWAWDPVENASIMPWIALIAGLHCLLAYKHSGYSLPVTMFLLLTAFILVLYSTFLTRSGILGDTSVHSFTDLGMSGQLLLFLFFFILLATVSLLLGWRHLPQPDKEEASSSREFWLFVGSLILTIYGFILTLDTSWPVINKITSLSWFKAIPLLSHYADNKTAIVDPISHYNSRSIWFAIVICLLIALVQYLRYKNTHFRRYVRAITPSLVLAFLLSLTWTYVSDMEIISRYHLGGETGPAFYFVSPYFMMLLAGLFAITANVQYIFSGLKGKLSLAGSSIAHLGFGLVMIGALLSNFHKEVLSINTIGLDFGDSFDEKNKRENIFLPFAQPVQMGPYWVTYMSDSLSKPDQFFKIKFEEKTKASDPPQNQFYLAPNAQVNPKMGLISNPDRKSYLTKDIFTYISSIPDNKANDTTEVLNHYEMAKGDTVSAKQALIILKNIAPHPAHPELPTQPGLMSVGAELEIKTSDGHSYYAEPIYYIDGSYEKHIPATVSQLGMRIKLEKLLPEKNAIKLSVVEEILPQRFVILKAIKFPLINLLWLGCLLMGVGFIIAMVRRRKEYRIITNGFPS